MPMHEANLVGTATWKPDRSSHGPTGLSSHIVQFYKSDAFLCETVARYIEQGLNSEELVLIVATQAHCRQILSHLATFGIDTVSVLSRGRMTVLDAHDTLAGFMQDGLPDPRQFRQSVAMKLQSMLTASPGTSVRVFGEMVDLLCKAGDRDAAIRVERLWEELIAAHPLSLLCAYDINQFRSEADEEPFSAICQCHAQVFPAEAFAQIDNVDSRRREICALQLRAQQLESEVERRKVTEQQLTEALATRDRFLSIAGHELRTPVAALRLQLQSLEAITKDSADPRLPKRLQKAVRQVSRMGHLVETILDVFRVSRGDLNLAPEPCNLSEIVRTVVARHLEPIADSPIRVTVQADDAASGNWDRARLEQVVDSLLTNAIKFGLGRPVEIAVQRCGDWARLGVRDSGMGISEEDQHRVFDRFERAASSRNFGGFGLGLWLSRQIIEAHGGEVRVQSLPGKGATFVVDLPPSGRPRS